MAVPSPEGWRKDQQPDFRCLAVQLPQFLGRHHMAVQVFGGEHCLPPSAALEAWVGSGKVGVLMTRAGERVGILKRLSRPEPAFHMADTYQEGF